MATRGGMVKKTPVKEYENVRKNGLQAIVLKEQDELIEVKATDNTKDIFLITKKGHCIRFHETDVRVTGRVSMGVIGMKLNEGDEVVGMQMDTQGEKLLIVSENGMGKRTPIEEFTAQNRGGKGVLCYKITEKTGDIVGCLLYTSVERAFTTEAPTPCRPPDTLYPPPPNLPPACRRVNTTSTAGIPAFF